MKIIQGFKGGDVRQPIIENEGVSVNVNGAFRRSSSKTKIEVLDLLGEGPMHGIVSGYHRMHGGYLGRTGWAQAEFIPYNDGILSGTNINSGVLRSVFYNDVPILDDSDRYNFSNIRFKFVNGTPMGATGVGEESIFDDELTITKQINEVMIGPNYSFDSDGQPTDVLVAGEERFDKYRGDYDKLYARDVEAALQNRKVYRYYDKNIVAFEVNVRINSLSYTEIEDQDRYGDSLSYFLDYKIIARPVFKGQDKNNLFVFEKEKKVSLKGKVSTSPFLQSDRIEVDDLSEQNDFLAWEIEVIRQTADAIHPAVVCSVNIDSITQIYTQTFRYPNSAMASNLFDAEFFSQVPETTYEVDMLKIKVPDNYDPISKNYDGVWDGTFSTTKKWSNNPAWVFYDMMTNKRYGVGDYIDEDLVDKWSLYQIGQYCDELVRDGYDPSESPHSGLEPRFETNVYITQQNDAYQVINDLASVFRGMTYYIGGSIDVSQDSPKEPRFVFTNANVVDGNFVYSSSSQKSRHTIALVRYNDKSNYYKPSVEYIEDPDGIRKYGLIQKDVTAIGCSSRGQAFRLGKWILTTERTETETVNFQAGLEANALRPGDVIKIFDENKTKKRYTGRTLSTKIYAYPNESGAEILLDRKVPLHNWSTYKFLLATPTYSYESSLVDKNSSFDSTDISGLKRGVIQDITFTGGPTTILNENGLTKLLFTGDSYTGFGMTQFNTGEYNVYNNLIFAIEQSGNIADNCEFDLFKVIRTEEANDSLYNVFAMQHNSGKYDIIETGLAFESDVSAPTIGTPVLKHINFSDEECKISFIVKKGSNTKFLVLYARKDGEEFASNSRPDNSYKESVVPIDSNSDTVIIDYNLQGDNVNYSFAIWGTDGVNFSSNGAVYSQYIRNCESNVCNFSVYSLRGRCGAGDGTAASKDTYYYEGASPTFKWNIDFDTSFKLDDDIYEKYETRISYYEPDIISASNGVFYQNGAELYRQANYGLAFDGEVQFDIVDNIIGYNNRNTLGAVGPFRNYDVVVDVFDKNNQKSSRDCNVEGFDMLAVRNPVPSPADIDAYYTNYTFNVGSAKVGGGGTITIDASFVDLEVNRDYAGFCLFYYPESFSAADVSTNNMIQFEPYFFANKQDKNIQKQIGLKGVASKAYVGIVILDTFDKFAVEAIRSRISSTFIDQESYYREKVATAERLTIVKEITIT